MSAASPLPLDLQGGSAENFSVTINRLGLIGGSVVTLPAPGVTVIVGANNVGKTTLLREIMIMLRHGPSLNVKMQALAGLDVRLGGTNVDFLDWFAKRVPYRRSPGQPEGFVGNANSQNVITTRQLMTAWNAAEVNQPRLGDPLASYLVRHMEFQERLQMVSPANRRTYITEPPTHPLHYLEDNAALMAGLNELCKRVFRESLTLDVLGTNARLLVGEPGIEPPRVDNITREYREAIQALLPLHEQGDGMKGLIGLCLPIITGSHPIIIVDEPEAFLHPPQAAALGRELGEMAKSRKLQLIVATHDRNIVTGLLSTSADISVVRLNRRGRNHTSAHQLSSQRLREVWSDPVLRYSNVLDGLFYHLVVLAEADGDCRFYSAALDKLAADADLPLTPTDVLFVPSGGKAGLGKLAHALHEVGVPVVATPDLDILDQSNLLKDLVSAFNGDWSVLREDYIKAIRPLNESGSLAQLKSAGISAFPSGEPYAAAIRLVESLQSIGIVPVRVGELERYAPTLGGKGPSWLSEALRQLAHESDAAQDHVRRLVDARAQVL